MMSQGHVKQAYFGFGSAIQPNLISFKEINIANVRSWQTVITQQTLCLYITDLHTGFGGGAFFLI